MPETKSETKEVKTRRKVREGLVSSSSMDKTVVVKVVRRVPHPLYRRIIRRTTSFKAHDEKNECGVGDRVKIIETRPLSKTKRWRLLEVIEKAKLPK